MKKIVRFTLIALISISFFGCGDDTDEIYSDSDQDNQKNEVTDDDNVTLKNMELIYWHLETTSGIPRLITKFYNPNNVPVSFSYTFVFKIGNKTIEYKDLGEWGNVCVAAGDTVVNWGTPNIDLNDAKNVDDIEITITDVSKSTVYIPVKITTIQDEITKDNDHKIAFKADGDFSACDIYVLYYYGDELQHLFWDCRFNSDQTPFYFESVGKFTKYEISYNAYYENFYNAYK